MPTALAGRERVRRALQRQEPDRVPRHFTGNTDIVRRLREHFGVDDQIGLLRALDCDLIHAFPAYAGPRLHPDDPRPDHRVDPDWGIRRRWIEHGSGGYWDYCDFPLAAADLDAVRAWPVPDPDDYDLDALERFVAGCEGLAVVVGHAGIGDVMNSCGFFFGMEQMLLRLIDDDPALHAFLETRSRIQCTVLARSLDRLGDRVDAVQLGEDLGTQRGPIISHEMFRSRIAPYMQRLIDIAVERGLPVILHSCGASHHFFTELADMGVTCMDTLQPEAEGMAPARLKRDFGDRLAFMGGLSTAGPLARSDEDGVRTEVRRLLDAFMPGGGYIFAPTHQVQDDTPTANVLAAFDEAAAYGAYG